MNTPLEQIEPSARSYSRRTVKGVHRDPPVLSENHLNLFTLPYAQLIAALAECLFPPNSVADTTGKTQVIRASDSQIERYIYFRTAWQPEFGVPLQLALRDLTEACLNGTNGKSHFVLLDDVQKSNLLGNLQAGTIAATHWRVRRNQASAFMAIYRAIAEGFFADPGYGGNVNGSGWCYSGFMTIEGAL